MASPTKQTQTTQQAAQKRSSQVHRLLTVPDCICLRNMLYPQSIVCLVIEKTFSSSGPELFSGDYVLKCRTCGKKQTGLYLKYQSSHSGGFIT